MMLDTLTWACLVLAAGADTGDVYHLNTGKFQIPIKIQPNRRSEIKELQLFVSRDQGKTWQLCANALPDKENFIYSAPDDGLYWFSVAVVDQKAQRDPVDIMKAPIGQKIVVDTRKPEVSVTAERRGEEILAHWEARDEYPDFSTMKIEYRSADGLWTPVPATLGPTGTATFRAGTAGPITVRVQLKDFAGNLGQGQYEVSGNGAGALPLLANSPAPPAPFSPSSLSPVNGTNATPPPSPSTWNTNGTNLPLLSQRTPEPLDPPGGGVSAIPVNSSPGASRDLVAVAPPPTNPLGTELAGLASRNVRGGSSEVKLVNKRQVKLDFEAKFGPSGPGNVDVYVTTDDGLTWTKQPGEVSGFPSAGSERPAGPVHASVTVELNREGVVHGFILVVKSRAGLGKPPPQRGDAPQLRVELDLTQPQAELFLPRPDPQRHDTLIMSWRASDRNLTENPITLEWADNRLGPWKPVGPLQLPNMGQYSWTVPANVPPKVYLRLTVRDAAGNTAVAQTDKAQDVDLVVPEVSGISLGNVSR